MGASIWNPGVGQVGASGDSVLTDYYVVPPAGPFTTIPLSNIAAIPGTSSVLVSRNGFWLPITDYSIPSSSSIQLNFTANAGDQFYMVGFRVTLFGADAENVYYTSPYQVTHNQSYLNLQVIDPVTHFGCDPTGVVDSTTRLQAFFDYITANGSISQIRNGDFLISDCVLITIGARSFKCKGVGSEGARFIVSSGFTNVLPGIQVIGSNTQAKFEFGGFSVRPSSAGPGNCTVGLQIGNDSATVPIIAPFNVSEIKDVFVADFPKCWKIIHATLLRIEDCAGWNNNYAGPNTVIEIAHAGLFTGDLTFKRFKGVTVVGSGKSVVSFISNTGAYNAADGNNSLAGIHFDACMLFGGDKCVKGYIGNASAAFDIWFENGTQVDQEVDYGYYIECNNSSSLVQNFHIESGYVNLSNLGAIVFTSTGTGGIIRSVWVDGNEIIRPQAHAVQFFGAGCKSAHVTNNEVTDAATADGAITFDDTDGFTCMGNRLKEGDFTDAPAYFIDITAGAVGGTVIGNDGRVASTAAIRDLSGDVAKVVTGNLDYNPHPEVTVVVGASPFTYKNLTGAAELVYWTGGTVTGSTINGRAVPTAGGQYYTLPAGRSLVLTHAGAPAMYTLGIE